MRRLKNTLQQYILFFLLGMALSGCNSMIYDAEQDCAYQVGFRYDYNMKWADAFPSEVTSVHLYVIGDDGTIVWRGYDSGEALRRPGYSMKVNIPPGSYTFLAWAGDEELGSFATCEAPLLKEQLTQEMKLDMDNSHGGAKSGRLDRLYYGRLEGLRLTPDDYDKTITVNLVKDTNDIRVILQHMSGADVPVEAFTFEIVDHNAALNSDNRVTSGNEWITYHPWDTYQGSASMGDDNGSRAITGMNVAVAEFSTGRLLAPSEWNVHLDRGLLSAENANKKAYLQVTKKATGKVVIRIPLIDALLLAKGKYHDTNADGSGQWRPLSDQEWLDREDDYNLTFFLDERDNWMDSYIYINSWMVVLQSSPL